MCPTPGEMYLLSTPTFLYAENVIVSKRNKTKIKY